MSARRALRGSSGRPARAVQRVSYAEPDEDDDDEFDLDDSEESALDEPTLTRRPRRNAKKRASTVDSSPASKKPKRSATAKNEETDMVEYAGAIPAWQELPYAIMVQIFRYAAYPLYHSTTFQPLPSGSWLLQTARVCKNFAEPAFTVLYSSPPLVPMEKAHQLVELLQADPATLRFPYRAKVESLRIEVRQVAAYRLQGSGLLDLFSFIKALPRLTCLEFYHEMDMAPYRELEGNIKWTYPASLFEALEYVDKDADINRGDKISVCRLASWRWSSRLAGKDYPIESIKAIHLKPSFISLKKIAFVNYHTPDEKKAKKDPENIPEHEKILAEAISVLPDLEHLIFECSTIANSILLPLLPTNLKTLELINCWEVATDDFGAFLLTHGHNLRCLILNHNISLGLSFLPSLGEACPRLEVLRMNLTYFDAHSTYRDSKPAYDQLLLAHEVPSWPKTLQSLELMHMRQWETDAAEMFFQSILDSAGDLPDLRKLKLNTILNIGWRDRASFRDKWIGSLDRVFKRSSPPPLPIQSLRKDSDKIMSGPVSPRLTFARQKSLRSAPRAKSDDDVHEHTPEDAPPRRTSSRTKRKLASGRLSPSSDDIDELAEDNVSSRRTSARSKARVASSSTAPSTIPSSLDNKSTTRRNAQRTGQMNEASTETQPEPSVRRTARFGARKRVSYAEDSSNDSGDEQNYVPGAEDARSPQPRKRRISTELKILQETAGVHYGVLPETPPATSDAMDSDEEPLVQKRKSKGMGKVAHVIQGMCDIVEIRIDNLRPTEIQVTEADFLDEEASGDDDWDGDDDADNDVHAW